MKKHKKQPQTKPNERVAWLSMTLVEQDKGIPQISGIIGVLFVYSDEAAACKGFPHSNIQKVLVEI